MGRPHPSEQARRLLLTAAKIFVSASLLGLAVWRIGLGRLRDSVAGANLWRLLAAVVVFTVSNLLGSLQWGMLLRGRGVFLRVRQVVGYYYVGLFFNNFLIGYVGGDAFRVFDAARASGNPAGAMSAVLLDRLVGFATLTSLAVVAALSWQSAAGHIVSLAVLVAVFLLWVLVLLFFFSKRVAKPVVYLFERVLPLGFKNRARQVYSQVNDYRHNPLLLLEVLGVSLVVQLLRVAVHYFAALSLGIGVNFLFFLVFVPIIALLSSLPVSLGGIGVREQSGVLLFSRIGVAEPGAVAMQFLAYLVGVVSTVPGGVVLALRREHRRADPQVPPVVASLARGNEERR